MDGTGTEWHWDRGARLAESWSKAGFDAVLAPPWCRGASLGNGYDPTCLHDLGRADVGPTRYGTDEQLARFAATLKANGIKLYGDAVMAHLLGHDGKWNWKYPGPDKRVKNGRFPRDRTCFRRDPDIPRDPVAVPEEDYDFGPEPAYRHGWFGDGNGKNAKGRYLIEGSTNALLWQKRRLEVDGWRWDFVKGVDPDLLRHWIDAVGGYNFGEYYDGSVDTLQWWINRTWRTCGAYDFSSHFSLRSMANNASRWDMRQLVNSGLLAREPMKALTFLESHDSSSGDWPVQWNQAGAYAFLMASEGTPFVYGGDYLKGPGLKGDRLAERIDNAVFVHNAFAHGSTRWRHADYQKIVFERIGAEVGKPGLLFALNNEMGDYENPADWRAVNVQTAFGPHVRLPDYSGHAETQWTDAQGRVTLWVPPNDNGRGYVFHAPDGHQGRKIAPKGRATRVVYEAAADLDIGPAVSDRKLRVCRVWCAARSDLRCSLDMDRTAWTDDSTAFLEVTDPAGDTVVTQHRERGGSDTSTAHGRTKRAGWHTATVIGTKLPAGGSPFRLALTYTAPKTLEAA